MKKDVLSIIAIVLLGASMYALTLRGAPGNPIVGEFKENLDTQTKAFELSPERGRYVHVANMAERGTYDLTHEWTEVAYPDVGVSPGGKYSSFFAPGVAYMTLPFYLVGEKYNLAQVATFAAESVITIITLIFIYLIGRRVFALSIRASLFAVLVYAFASTSWSYAITLYQNAFTTCFMVTGFYAAWRFAHSNHSLSWVYAAYVWLAYALAITVDYPNAILMLPVMIYLAYSTFGVRIFDGGIRISIRWGAILTVIFFILLTSLHLWHNATYYGGWGKTAGGLKNYVRTPVATTSVDSVLPVDALSAIRPATTATTSHQKEKDVVGFFHEYKMFDGAYILLISNERGLFFFSPIFLLALVGIIIVCRRAWEREAVVTMLSLVTMNILLYSSWGDPWGGWAYGPRYLIPSMAWLSLFVAVSVAQLKTTWGSVLARGVALLLFAWSCAVALLGALTTNAIPPKSEALLLPIKGYTYLRDLDFLRAGSSGSFIYNTYFAQSITLVGYYIVLYAIVMMITVLVLIRPLRSRHE